MKYYGKKSLCSILNVILNIILVFGVFLSCKTYYDTFTKNNMKSIQGIIIAILLTVGVICTFLIVIEFKKIIKTLIAENPFVWSNVKSLRKITIGSLVIAGCYFINYIVNIKKATYSMIYIDSKGVHTDAEIFIFLLFGCFMAILSKLFEEAIKYKEDNDLTI